MAGYHRCGECRRRTSRREARAHCAGVPAPRVPRASYRAFPCPCPIDLSRRLHEALPCRQCTRRSSSSSSRSEGPQSTLGDCRGSLKPTTTQISAVGTLKKGRILPPVSTTVFHRPVIQFTYEIYVCVTVDMASAMDERGTHSLGSEPCKC